MSPLYCKSFLTGVLAVIIGYTCHTQNLLPNPSFEIYTTCPTNLNQGQPMECIPWNNATDGTSDYFNSCAASIVSVPTNSFGSQLPHTGNGYVGSYYKLNNFVYREYIQAPLLSPLIAGQYYYFSMYVSPADLLCPIGRFGAYFSVNPPQTSGILPLPVTPQVDYEFGFISDEQAWTLVEGCFYASGGEQYITIGNFHDDPETPIDPNCNPPVNTSYYYIDDVYLGTSSPTDPLDLDLGDPVTACVEYLIDPQIPDVHYTWEDGSHGTTLLVTESGTYTLTITSACAKGIDSLEVEIIGTSDTVDIGPSVYTMCDGDTYEISLDPGAGDYEWSDGSTGSAIEITTSGTYAVTLDDDGCDFTSDQVDVTVLVPPDPFSLGPDTHICAGDELDFSFDPALGNFLWSDGSTSSDYSITYGGIYTLTISNVCGEYSDDILVEEIAAPVVTFDPDHVTLCNGDSIELELDPAIGDYLWQDGNTDNNYTISTPGHYAVTVYNECGVDNDDLFVDSIPDPVVNLGPDIVICNSQLPILFDVSNSGGDSYHWQDGSTGSQFQVTAAGAYSVTVSNVCDTVMDQVNITVQSSLVNVSLPPDQNLCQGQTFIITNSGDNGNYTWQDNSTADTLLVSTPGVYALTINTQCGVGSDTVVVNYIPAVAVPDLGPDLSLCPGEQIVLSPNISGVTYLWSDNSTADSLLVIGAGNYFVQVADQCTSASDTINVDLNNNPPQLSLPSQLNLCQGNSLTLDAVIGGVSYVWNDNSQASTLTVTSPGTYSLTVSNSCGTDMDTVVVLDAGPTPSISLGNDVQLCPGDVISLSPVSSNVTSWLWSNGSTADSYSVNGDELVTVEVTNSCGVSYDTLIATLLPATPPIDLGADTSLCPGNTLLLTITTPNVNVEWSDGSVNNQFLVNGPGNYYATISNSCGENADTIIVGSLPPAPLVNLGIDQSLCPGEVITLDPGVINATYLWQDGSTSTTFNATQAGTIILSVSNACGIDSDTLEITESTEGPQVNLGPDVTACEGDMVTVMSDISGVNYLWQDGSTSPDFSTNTAGTFILQVSNNCGVDTDTVQVNLMTAPIAFDLGPDTTICPGESILLHAPATSSSIKWQDGSTGPTFLADKAQTYSLELSNNCGSTTDELVLSFDDRVPIVKLDSVFNWCPGAELELNVTQLFPATYLWNTGSTSPVITIEKQGHYSVDVQAPCADAFGETDVLLGDTCFSIPSFFIPNVFSPNGDNINDVFSVMPGSDVEIRSVQGTIYDRWGNVVFESDAIPFEWNGDFNGSVLNPGVFVYRIELKYIDQAVERSVILSGDVTLVR